MFDRALRRMIQAFETRAHDLYGSASSEQTGISKTEVVVSALASYLGCTEEISLTERMASIEAKMAQLEAMVKSK